MDEGTTQRNEITRKPVVYKMPGMDAVTIRRDLPYRTDAAGTLTMDLYSPPEAQAGAKLPAVIFVSGYPDPGVEAMLGCKLKDMEAYVSWGRLVAASGMVAIGYSNRDPVADLDALLEHLRDNAATLGIDGQRIAIWACSGNVPVALSALMRADSARCAVLCYGYMLDGDGTTGVADAAAQIGFANPCADKSIADLPGTLPLLVVRAGGDQTPGLNRSIDAFAAAALARDLPITLANLAGAPHAFDMLDDSETSREMIRRILAFMSFHLGA